MKKLRTLSLIALFLLTTETNVAHACCWGCRSSDCSNAEDTIADRHDSGGSGSESEESMVPRTKYEFDQDLERFQEWLIEVMLQEEFAPGTAALVSQMSAVAMLYTESIGMFLDAQIMMDTQRVFRELKLEAHSDYIPSEDFCWFGTNVTSLAATDMKARYNALALGEASITRQLGEINQAGSSYADNDLRARWDQFTTNYCDIRDNNGTRFNPALGDVTTLDRTGLKLACGTGAELTNRVNRDVDYTRLIDEPRTIDVDFTNEDLDTNDDLMGLISSATGFASGAAGVSYAPNEEEDVIAMARNLYGHEVLSREISGVKMPLTVARKAYLSLRSVAARRSVAQASFNAIVGLKSYGTSAEQNGATYDIRALDESTVTDVTSLNSSLLSGIATSQLATLNQTQRYMAKIIEHLLPMNGDPQSITLGTMTFTFEGGNLLDFIGYSPSYYSQLEVLAKRIYQIPTFYSNLYDTPANVARKKVAMQAIELMVDRATYESQLRREMSISVLLSSKLRPAYRDATKSLSVGVGK